METAEHTAFSMISDAGDAQARMMDAIAEARKGRFDKADALMRDAEKLLAKAHQMQTELLKSEADGTKTEYSILQVHAQDHLMNGMLSKQLIREMIGLYKEIKA